MYKNFSEEVCKTVQEKLSDMIIMKTEIDTENVKNIAGVDLAYWEKEGTEYAVCCVVVIDGKSKEIIESVHSVGEIDCPYIAGYLAFREIPLVMEAVEKLKNVPDLYVFDGNGYLHPRHMGIATHAAIYLEKPSIGVAKSYYKINDTDFDMPENIEGAYTDIVINNEVYGRVLRTHKDVKPVFISVGNYIDLETSTKIVKSLVSKESHIPIPTRLADLETHKMREVYKNK